MLLTLALGNTIVAGDAGKPEGQVSVNAVRRSQVPRILPGNRAAFEVKAPEAKKVQLDLGRLYVALCHLFAYARFPLLFPRR